MSDRSDIAAQHVNQVLRRLEPLPPPSATPALVVLSGPPGAGKSTIARRLRDAAPVAIVASDFVRKTLFPQPTYSNAEHAQVFVAAHRVLRTLLRRSISTVFDATNLREDARRSAGGVARAAGARLLLVAVTAPAGRGESAHGPTRATAPSGRPFGRHLGGVSPVNFHGTAHCPRALDHRHRRRSCSSAPSHTRHAVCP